MRHAAAESRNKRPGGEAMLERMSEMMFVEAVRRYVETLSRTAAAGWPACATASSDARWPSCTMLLQPRGRLTNWAGAWGFRARLCTSDSWK